MHPSPPRGRRLNPYCGQYSKLVNDTPHPHPSPHIQPSPFPSLALYSTAGHSVSRMQPVSGIDFCYQPPPRSVVPHAAALKSCKEARTGGTARGAVTPSVSTRGAENQSPTSTGPSMPTFKVSAPDLL
jgi:hypothetical protein